MNRLSAFFALLAAVAVALCQGLTVGTYNLRQLNSDDVAKGNGWEKRSPWAADLIEFVGPDIFGTQEMFASQLADLKELLPEYDYIGLGRDDGKEAGEHSAIFYNRQRLEPLRSGTFWLSETPEQPGLGWDAACPRVCSWGEFADKAEGDTIYFFNLHMDHVGIAARRNGAKLVVDSIAEIALTENPNAVVVLTGDFNVDQTDEIYAIFTESGFLADSYAEAERRFAPNGTFNGWHDERFTPSRIDHVFISPALQAKRYAILTDTYWDQGHERRLPSDHYPVFVKVEKK